ncbi:MAG: hypothetical protein QG650_953 [Patescibacteria group bacterium]|nr:hypothetical protein [Patescibacteria group bacterium]
MERTFIALFGIIGILLVAPIFWLGKAFWVTAGITVHHVALWGILILLPLSVALAFKAKKAEPPVDWRFFTPVWAAFFFVYYTASVYQWSGIADKSIINAQAVRGEWEESYTAWRTETVCTAHGKDGGCTSSHTVTHCDDEEPNRYSIGFSDGSEHGIERGNWQALVQKFGNRKEVPVSHADQCSSGDGRKFVTEFQAGKSHELYVSYEIPVVNYILAGRSLYKTSVEETKPFLPQLRGMPGISEHPAGIGPWKNERLISVAPSIPEDWKKTASFALDRLNGILGPSKEVNVVLYVVDTADRSFVPALEAHWKHGKKNQLTVVIGSTAFPKVDWADAIDFWSEKPEIRINLRDKLQTMSLDDPRFFATIEKEVVENWQRKRMRTFEYLAWDLTIPWWAYLLVTVFTVAISALFGRFVPSFFGRY